MGTPGGTLGLENRRPLLAQSLHAQVRDQGPGQGPLWVTGVRPGVTGSPRRIGPEMGCSGVRRGKTSLDQERYPSSPARLAFQSRPGAELGTGPAVLISAKVALARVIHWAPLLGQQQ